MYVYSTLCHSCSFNHHLKTFPSPDYLHSEDGGRGSHLLVNLYIYVWSICIYIHVYICMVNLYIYLYIYVWSVRRRFVKI